MCFTNMAILNNVRPEVSEKKKERKKERNIVII